MPARIASWLLLIAAPAVVYAQVVGFEFVLWDDPVNVTENPYLSPVTFENTLAFWTRSYFGLFAPLTYTFWAALAWLGGTADEPFNAPLFHAANLALHIGCVLLVHSLLRRLVAGELGPLVGALLFALHPLQAETVSWATEARGLLSMLFGLAALNLFAAGRLRQRADDTGASPQTSPRPPLFGWATILFAAALLSKASAVSIPLIAIAIDALFFRRSIRTALYGVADWLVMAALWVVITRFAQPQHLVPVDSPLWARPLVAADALAFYLYKLVWPLELAIDYGRAPSVVMGSWWAYVAWLVPAALTIVLLFARPLHDLRLAGAIAVAALLPVLGLVPFHFQQFSTVADRYMYPAMLGPAFAAAWLIARGRWPLAFVALGVLLPTSYLTWQQAATWRDSEALFHHALEINPRSVPSHTNLGVMCQRAEDATRAEQHYRAALEINPEAAQANTGLAGILLDRGEEQKAFDLLLRAHEVSPHNDQANAGLARIYRERGDIERALKHYRLALNPDPSQAAPTLSRAQRAAVAESLARTLATVPDARSQYDDEAVQYAREAVQLTGGRSLRCLDTLAAALASSGRFEEAVDLLQRAVQTARADGHHQAAEQMTRHLELYRQEKPLREQSSATTSE